LNRQFPDLWRGYWDANQNRKNLGVGLTRKEGRLRGDDSLQGMQSFFLPQTLNEGLAHYPEEGFLWILAK